MGLSRLYTFAILSLMVADCLSYSEGCDTKFDKPTCSYIYNCTYYFIENDLNDYQIQNYIHMNCIKNGESVVQLHVFLKDTENVGAEIPKFRNNHEMLMITSLDISNNGYITCPTLAAMNKLVKLTISRNSLTTATLSNPNKLESLAEIDLSHNFINSIEVNDYAYPYTNLEKINLSNNYLVKIPDTTFVQFSKIISLDLSHNYINALNVLTFEGLKNILYLNLSYNRIFDINLSLLRFNNLAELNLSNNRIAILKKSDFEKLQALEKLDLSFNIIKNIGEDIFNGVNLLRDLDLSNNEIESIDKDTFTNVSKIQTVNLSENEIRLLPKGLFKGKQLIFFSIKENSMEGSLLKGMFEGLKFVTELDLSHQHLNSVEDFAFFGLDGLQSLLLNNNNIQTISKNSFKTLLNLKKLDLSSNSIFNMHFAKEDLVSLHSLLLHNNYLTQVKLEYFNGINSLSSLDLSNNEISELDSNSFQSLNELVEIKISNNPINGTLKEKTFGGLLLLPILDISGTLLSVISNNSFEDMTQLKDLNMSHSRINELQYNSFCNTGAIEVLDLSFNELKYFDLNTTSLINLNVLILNNNLLSLISSNSFRSLPRLIKILLSHNNIKTIHDNAFNDQKDLRSLDLSFNSELQFNVSQIEKTQFLVSLILSDIRTNITFKNVGAVTLSELDISNSSISNINVLELNRLKKLESLVLSKNIIVKVEMGAFSDIKHLRQLDLSSNKISFIQPGVFRDNKLLYSLNISHNALTTLNYGIFRGLIYLNTIDMSFNNIDNLDSALFHEVTSLTELIVDHNNVEFIESRDFIGTSLSVLSIGGNPLPCNLLVDFKKIGTPLTITAISKDESNENVDGVTCNVNSLRANTGNDDIFIDIRDILRNLSTVITTKTHFAPVNNLQYLNVTSNQNTTNLLTNLVNENKESNTDLKTILLQMTNITTNLVNENKDSNIAMSEQIKNLSTTLVDGNKNTNSLLDRMLKLFTTTNTLRKSTSVPMISQENSTFAWMAYINKIKEELEDALAVQKQNILAEIQSEISSLDSRKETTVMVTSAPAHEALSNDDRTESRPFLFIEVCLGLILIVLVGFILYKLYNNHGIFIPNERSLSRRNLPEAIDTTL